MIRAAGGPLPPGIGGRNNTGGGITNTPILYSPPQAIINPTYVNKTTPITTVSDDPDSQNSKATCPKFWTMTSLILTYMMFFLIHNFLLL